MGKPSYKNSLYYTTSMDCFKHRRMHTVKRKSWVKRQECLNSQKRTCKNWCHRLIITTVMNRPVCVLVCSQGGVGQCRWRRHQGQGAGDHGAGHTAQDHRPGRRCGLSSLYCISMEHCDDNITLRLHISVETAICVKHAVSRDHEKPL